MRRLLLFIPLLLVVGFSLILWRGIGQDPNNQDDAILGRPLPDISAENLLSPGQSVSLHSLAGKPLILNVWASWCPNCKAEHQFLMRLSRTAKIYGISYRDKPEAARNWLERAGNPFQMVLDDQQGKLAIELGVYGTPETLLYSAEGRLVARYTGTLTEDIWSKVFVPLLPAAFGQGSGTP